ncbi:MmcB family DNA repair protein [Pontivivens nitratireducens]|uniref:MmcB family DNA repair protein n=1 Tax=Pontivivens nitratireducens TaxID=2758038 RepID=A0A6G7VK87_9RHOB|nr:MmcB family DNA repair protein [Pontibrevibacter nitratireducens]QIK40310.1 MmcB family DNA repair protein [Pontibrevibacter nitratireducens]
MTDSMAPGFEIARGVWRHLDTLDMTALTEFTPVRGLRVDVIGLTAKGEIWIVECKSSLGDFRSDAKWQNYLEWCDRFFWAVPQDFPVEVLPEDTGLMIADRFDAAIVRDAPLEKMPGARRKAMTLKLARAAMRRQLGWLEPDLGAIPA